MGETGTGKVTGVRDEESERVEWGEAKSNGVVCTDRGRGAGEVLGEQGIRGDGGLEVVPCAANTVYCGG